jgi:threonine/homoserine/homoserine lactone efflux protein
MAITIATLFLPKNGSLALALAVMLVVMIGVNFGCITLWAGFGGAMRRFLDHAARRRIFNAIMAALLAATAVLMVVG